MSKSDGHNQLLRALPSIDALLKTETAKRLAHEIGAAKLASLARLATENLRQELIERSPGLTLQENGNSTGRGAFLKQAEAQLLRLHEMQIASGVRPVINATGVIVHTNLGRAPLSQAARDAIIEASGYCTLE